VAAGWGRAEGSADVLACACGKRLYGVPDDVNHAAAE